MLVNSILFIPLLFYQFRLPSSPMTWILVFLSVGIFALSAAFMFKSYQHLELSLLTILQRFNIIFVAIIGIIFLGERLSLLGIAGLLFLFIGSSSILYENKRFTLSAGAWYTILSALLSAIAAVLDKAILKDFSPYTYAFINNLLVGCAFLWRKDTLSESLQFLRRYPIHIVSSSFFGMIGFTTLLVVLAQTQVSQTMPVYKTVSFFIPVVLGVIIYKEQGKLIQKMMGVFLAITGILLLYAR